MKKAIVAMLLMAVFLLGGGVKVLLRYFLTRK